MKLEKDLQKEILHYLNSQDDFFCWRNSSTGVYGQGRYRKKVGFDIKGTSDILGIYSPSGRMVAIEVKREGSTKCRVSVEQFAFLKKITKMGGAAVWVNSLEEVKRFINMIRGDI